MSRGRGRGPRLWVALVGLGLAAGCGGPRVELSKTDPRLELELGRAEFNRKHSVEAQTHLRRFLDLNPGNAAADSAQLLLGMSLFQSKSYAEAAVEFAILGREYPRSPLRDAASYHECLSYFQQLRSPELDPTFGSRAQTCFNEFLLRFPETGLRGEAEARLGDIDDRFAEKEFRLGVMFAKMKRPAAARVYLEGLLETHPRSRWTAPALGWIGRAQEEQGDPAAAAATYRRLIAAAPEGDPAREGRARLQAILSRHPELRDPADSLLLEAP